MKRVFLDLGGHRASSIRFFFDNWKDASEWEIHSFEPNVEFAPFYQNLPPNVTFHNVAIGMYDGYSLFYNNHGGSSTTLLGKAQKGGFAENAQVVPTINFSKWLDENFDGTEEITIKFDTETNEYSVLRKMILDGTISKVKTLFCEFHWFKSAGQITEMEHVTLVEDLVNLEKTPYGWQAQDSEDAEKIPFHWKLGYSGKEHSMIQSPELKARHQKMIDLGNEILKGKTTNL